MKSVLIGWTDSNRWFDKNERHAVFLQCILIDGYNGYNLRVLGPRFLDFSG